MTGRPTLVLVPGLSGRPGIDFPFLAPMLRRGFEVTEVTFDGLAEVSLDGLAARVREAIAACPTPPIVVGYSLGAAAVVLAAAGPTPVAAVVLVAGWWHPAPALVLFGRIWRALRAEGSSAVDDLSRFALASTDGLSGVRTLPADALTDSLVALAARTDLADAAPALAAPAFTAPVLVIGASADTLATTHQSRLLFGAIAEARYAEVPSGHAVPQERAAELLELMATFAADPRRYPPGTVIPESAP